MKAVGMVRRIDDLGRVVVPKEIRDTFGWDAGTPLEIYVDEGQTLVMRRYARGCLVCGAAENLVQVGNVPLCPKCVDKFVKVASGQ